jgi:hypothetical protein
MNYMLNNHIHDEMVWTYTVASCTTVSDCSGTHRYFEHTVQPQWQPFHIVLLQSWLLINTPTQTGLQRANTKHLDNGVVSRLG